MARSKIQGRLLRLQHQRPGWLITAALFLLLVALWLIARILGLIVNWNYTGNLSVALLTVALIAVCVVASGALLGLHFGLEGLEKRSTARRLQRSVTISSSTKRKEP